MPHIPSRRKTSMKPWITPSILCSINKKTQLYQKYLRRRNKVNEDKYKTYRNILVKTIRDAKRLYVQDALGQHRNDGKATWDLLNQVINKKNKTTNKYPTLVTIMKETFIESKTYLRVSTPFSPLSDRC